MKKYIYAFIGLFLSFVSFAQNKGINYQAVILDPNPIEIPGQSIAGQPLSNGKVCVRFAIMSSSGTTEYMETHKTQTDEYGLVNLVIGGSNTNAADVISLGNGAYSEFNSIKWDSKVKSLKVSVSFDGCSSFKEIANQPFNYTPYALYAGSVEYKNVEGAPTSLSQFSNDVGYLIPKDLDPVKKDILLTQNNIVSLSEKTDGKFLVVNQQISSIDSTNKSTKEKLKLIDGTLSSHDSRIAANDDRITTTDNRITQTNTYVNQQVGGLQTQINSTNTTINQLGVTYEVVSNKSTDTNLGAASPSNELYPSQLAVKSYVDVTVQDAIASGAPDATTLAKGKVKLAGDLSGTAESPTVPGLSLKENVSNKSTNVVTDGGSDAKYPSVKAIKDYVDNQVTGSTIIAGATSQYYRGDKTWQTLDKSAVGLNNVDNTSDAGKPVSTATQSALDLKLAKTDTLSLSNRIDTKQSLANKSTNVNTDATSDIKYPSVKAVKDYVDAQITGSALTAGTTTQYYRGDKTWQTLDKSAVGLSNVDNTTDAGKPISTATQSALDLKLAKVDTISLSNRIDTKQSLANKSTNVSTDATSDIKYPSVKAVKDYVDAQITGSALAAGTTTQYYRGDKTWQTLDKSAVGLSNVDNTTDAGKPVSTATQSALNLKENASNKSDDVNLGSSTSLYPTQNAVKSYVDAQVASVTTADGSITNAKIGETLSIANGGTGATTKSAAFNALSPMTASGDIIYGGLLGSSSVLPKGTDGQVLTLASGLPSWVNPAATGITSLGGLTGGTQTFATGTTGSDFGISSSGTTHTFNLPDASATARGLVTTGTQTFAGSKTFNKDLTVNGMVLGRGTGDFMSNSILGKAAFVNNTTGEYNTGFGFYSLNHNTTGFDNTAIGYFSLLNNTVGYYNTGVGKHTLLSNTSGVGNTGIGNEALTSNTTGSNNTALGNGSLLNNSTGDYNTGIGSNSLYSNSGTSNVAVGESSLYNTTTGNNNVAVGTSSGMTNSTGSENTIIGFQADMASSGLSNATAIGKGAIVNASNKIQLGNTSVTAVATSGKLTTGAITLPNTDGTSGQVLSTNGSGTVSWTTPSAGGVTTIGSVAGSSTANGATVTSGTLSLAPADGTNPGIVTTGAQTIAGDKTFKGSVSAAAAVNSSEITASFTITSTNASQYNGNVIVCNPSSAINITIDNSTTIPTGFNFMVVQKSAAANRVNFVAGTSATIVNRGGNTATAGQYAIATMVHIGNGVFVTSGDML